MSRPLAHLLVATGLVAACNEAVPTNRGDATEAPPIPDETPARAYVERPPLDARKTASGLITKVFTQGRGERTPKRYDQVRVHFTSWNTKGKLSDSSEKRGGPTVFDLQQVIPGLAEGITLMKVGEQRRLWIPDHLGYPGRPGSPRGMMVFDVELLAIIDGKPPLPPPDDVAAPPADAKRTASGLAYKLLEETEGTDKPNPWDRVTLRYAGWTSDGEMFDSSQRYDEPPSFDLGDVMPGWTEGVQLLTVGERARFWIPEALAHAGKPGPPRGMLVFDIELVSIERRPEPPRAPKQLAAPPKDAKRTASGLAYRFLVHAKGTTKPTASSHVRVSYSGWTSDGELFDSSVVRGKPATFSLDSVIAGWSEGLQLMTEGDKALFWIPEKLAYAGKPAGPPGMLVFEVELLEILP
jgi:FKBP-type peptidyl-prolyl cis-trans isomerase